LRKELYDRIHPELRAEMANAAWIMTEGFITRANIAERQAAVKQHALQEIAEAKKNGNPLFDEVSVEEKYIPGLNPGDPEVRILLMRPKAAEGILPGCVAIHGGGTILCPCESEQLNFMKFAKLVNCVVVTPDYRLAPQNPYPAGFNDCCATLEWLYSNADELGVDRSRLAVEGTSAGGLMSAAVCLKARDEGKIKLAAAFIGSPMLDYRSNSPSVVEMDEETFPWNGPQNTYAWEMYLNGLDPVPPYASPAMAEDLSGLPHTIIYSNELDPLRDETIEYAQRLYWAKVPTDLHVFPGCFHGADIVGANLDITQRLNDLLYKGMYNLLHKGYF